MSKTEDLSGQTIKQFKVLGLIGKGGMGKVYLGQDTILDRKVALKFLPDEIKDDVKNQARFLREAKAAAALDHPFICKIYETGEVKGKAFIAMEFVEGKTLKDKIEAEPFTMKESLRIALEIAEALETAHKNGIVHRDLKPANIMLTSQDHVKIMDFGLAKQFYTGDEDILSGLPTQVSITQDGAVSGTLAYMSPEQVKGEDLDGRSDIFALGIILQEMITQKHPFLRSSPMETMSAVLRDPPPSIKTKAKTLMGALSPILNKALAKDLKQRYQSASELKKDLQKLQKETTGGKWYFFRSWPAILASIFVIVLAVVGTLWISSKNRLDKTSVHHDPVSILVADFQNNTNDSIFDGALEQAMGIGMEGASFVTVYKRPNARLVAKQLNPQTEGKLDSHTAQLVCVREGISLFIEGSIEPKGNGYILKASARDSVNPENIIEYSKTVSSKSEVLNAAAWLSNKIRKSLGDIAADANKALSGETFTTSSLEALNAYTKAQEFSRQGKQNEAITKYLEAIEADQDFGRAYSGLALVYRNRGQQEQAEEYFQEALARIDRMSEREKFRTRAIYYLINRNFSKAIEECQQLVELYPADYAGHTNLALAYFYAHDYSQAKTFGLKATELYPKNVTPRYNLSWYALAAGDSDTAEREAQSVIDINPEFDEAYVVLALSNLIRNDVHTASQIYNDLRSVSKNGESLSELGLADLALYEGRLSNALDILEERIQMDLSEENTVYLGNKWALLAHTRLLSGKRSLALDAADQTVVVTNAMGPLYMAAQIYLQTEQDDKVLSIIEKLNQRLGLESRVYAQLLDGEMKVRKGNFQEAVDLLRKAQETLDTWLGRFTLGKAYLEMEAYPDAHSEFESCLQRIGETTSVFFDDVPSFHTFSYIYYFLGVAQQGMGSAAASESFQKFLEIKEKVDWPDPIVLDARQRNAKSLEQ